MCETIKDFQEFREKMNQRILASGHLEIKRFFALDSAAYRDQALPAKTKELLGLVASLVLRCNDCVTYHLLTIFSAVSRWGILMKKSLMPSM